MRAKKSLGQHFLTSQGALQAIVNAADLKASETVLEIGPGKGILTAELLKIVASPSTGSGQVIAVEKDRELVAFLQEKFATEIKNKKFVLIEDDILNYQPKGEYKLVANIPYNITGAIIEKFLSNKHQPTQMVLLVQKEVAERIVAKNEKESILSLSVKVFGEPKYIQTVKAGSFNPPPKVDSAILQINDISRANFNKNRVNEPQFFTVVKAGFAHKRKTISNNLRGLKISEEKLKVCGIKNTDRAEDLNLNHWLCLAKK